MASSARFNFSASTCLVALVVACALFAAKPAAADEAGVHIVGHMSDLARNIMENTLNNIRKMIPAKESKKENALAFQHADFAMFEEQITFINDAPSLVTELSEADFETTWVEPYELARAFRETHFADEPKCKDCVKKAIEYFAKKTIFDTAKFCHDAMKKDNPDPRVQKFCMFAKENPKKAVAVIWMKMHVHPIFMGFMVCQKKGYCGAPKPQPRAAKEMQATERGAVTAVEMMGMMRAEEISTPLLQELLYDVGGEVTGIADDPDGQCSACVKQAMEQLREGFEKSAGYVCKFSSKIPNEDFQQFCNLVETKPKEAFALLLKALKITPQQLKQSAVAACQREGMCTTVQPASRASTTSETFISSQK